MTGWPRWALGLVVVLFVAWGGAPFAHADGSHVRIERRQKGSQLDVDVDAEILPVLDALRASARINVITNADLRGRVRFRAAGIEPAAALRRIVAAAGLWLEEADGPVYLVRRRRPADGLRIDDVGRGGYRVPERLGYDVYVVPDGTDDVDLQAVRAALSRLEVTKGISLTVAPDVVKQGVDAFNETRGVLALVLERAGLPLALPKLVTGRKVRVYLNTADHTTYYMEILLAEPTGGLSHLVYIVEAAGHRRILRLVIFRTRPTKKTR